MLCNSNTGFLSVDTANYILASVLRCQRQRILGNEYTEPEIEFNNFICMSCQVHFHQQAINSIILIEKV